MPIAPAFVAAPPRASIRLRASLAADGSATSFPRMGARRSVTTVKKNDPPGTKQRR